ncbi:MAG: hypothetical protein MHPSP_002149 [Paramarteilia canceri]
MKSLVDKMTNELKKVWDKYINTIDESPVSTLIISLTSRDLYRKYISYDFISRRSLYNTELFLPKNLKNEFKLIKSCSVYNNRHWLPVHTCGSDTLTSEKNSENKDGTNSKKMKISEPIKKPSCILIVEEIMISQSQISSKLFFTNAEIKSDVCSINSLSSLEVTPILSNIFLSPEELKNKREKRGSIKKIAKKLNALEVKNERKKSIDHENLENVDNDNRNYVNKIEDKLFTERSAEKIVQSVEKNGKKMHHDFGYRFFVRWYRTLFSDVSQITLKNLSLETLHKYTHPGTLLIDISSHKEME